MTKIDIFAEIVQMPHIWFIHLIQNIKKCKLFFNSLERLVKMNGLNMCLKLKYERYIPITVM